MISLAILVNPSSHCGLATITSVPVRSSGKIWPFFVQGILRHVPVRSLHPKHEDGRGYNLGKAALFLICSSSLHPGFQAENREACSLAAL